MRPHLEVESREPRRHLDARSKLDQRREQASVGVLVHGELGVERVQHGGRHKNHGANHFGTGTRRSKGHLRRAQCRQLSC